MFGLRHLDINGRAIQVGDTVRYGTETGEVLIVEGPIPGSQSTREGQGTVLVAGVGQFGDNRVAWACDVEVVA